jgi:protein tyrosine phosphatase
MASSSLVTTTTTTSTNTNTPITTTTTTTSPSSNNSLLIKSSSLPSNSTSPNSSSLLPLQQQQQQLQEIQKIVQLFIQHVKKLQQLNNKSGFQLEYDRAKQKAEGKPGYFNHLTKQTNQVMYRNRYSNVITLDETRVRLVGEENEYINASFVGNGRFIATQAPLPHTTRDFWIMCLLYQVPCIVMLTPFEEKAPGGVRQKSSKYFPQNVGQVLEEQDISIHCLSCQNVLDGLIERKLCIKRKMKIPMSSSLSSSSLLSGGGVTGGVTGGGGEEITHIITHLHFISWPDFGRLSGSNLSGILTTLQTMKKIEAIHQQNNQIQDSTSSTAGTTATTTDKNNIHNNIPSIIHCSAGIGRSGTFIALALILERLLSGQISEINVVDIVAELRNQRPLMVQTVEQFEMIYDGLLTVLNGVEVGNFDILMSFVAAMGNGSTT